MECRIRFSRRRLAPGRGPPQAKAASARLSRMPGAARDAGLTAAAAALRANMAEHPGRQ